MKDVEDLLEQLVAIDDTAIVDGVSNHYLSFQVFDREESGVEAQLHCNREGLIYLAKVCLGLAGRDPGAHYHLDESGIADQATPPLVISKRLAPWEETHES